MDYDKTVIVISHNADFLNAFTDGVLYLDNFTKKIENMQATIQMWLNKLQRGLKRTSQNA